jgi:predicted outer membrane repeat protein
VLGRCFGVCIGLASIALAALPAAAEADICSATDGATLSTALADVNCNTINLGPGTYTSASGFTVAVPAFPGTRTAIINGPGAGSTTITRSGAGDVLTVPDRATLGLSGATLGGASAGAGLAVAGIATLNNDVIGGNTSSANGAGINFTGHSLIVTSSVITQNTTSGQGGGVLNAGNGTVMTPATATFQADLFTDNASTGAGGGGAFDTETANTVTSFKDVTFEGNQADADGGAVRSALLGAQTNLNNVTMVGNVADHDNAGGGDGGGLSNSAGIVTIANSIVANNTATGGGAPDCDSSLAAPLTRLGYELIKNQTGCTFGSVVAPPITDTSTGYLTGVDPQLGGLTDNGGPTQTRRPLATSPVINAGNPATPSGTGGACEATDQRGQPRTTSRVLPCDMGAFEVQSPFCSTFGLTMNQGETATLSLGCASVDPFVYALVSGPSHGSLSGFDPLAGTVDYVPAAGFAGKDSFTYEGVYGPISSNIATVNLTVEGPQTQSPNSPGVGLPGFNLKKAIKRCKKRVPKGPKRTKCIKKAKKRARNLS